ncbi:putative phage integrase [Janibacter sp. HTCC2649]|uniref:site-specific integrase n=1 Tax=Janibacter sp. HTCC2649 TaxID=313589 RepID=UPI000066EA37|nr:site-specific integrase [Janibacter sp. HTCC2649]EAP99443.1 putative phage integrase [Janibacter sp. HTCC2649]
MSSKKVYEKRERGIREVFREYPDGRKESAGFEVRVGQKRVGGLIKGLKNAQKIREAAAADNHKGAFIAPSEGKATVKEMADRWLNGSKAAKWKPRTRAGYEGIVRHRLAPLHAHAVKDVTPAVVDAFLASMLKEGLAPSTVRHVYHVLNQSLRLAVRDRLILANPCADVDRPGLVRDKPAIPERDEVEKLLNALADLPHDRAAEWSLYAEVAAYAGLRAGEITGLRVSALLPLENSLLVNETVTVISGSLSAGTPKSRAGKRRVPLPPSLSARLIALSMGKARDAYVFGDGTTPFRHGNFYRRVFRPAAAAVGLPTLTFHQLRHFYASVLLTNPNLSAVDIAKVLGHADANLLFNTYGHSFKDAGAGVGEWLDTLRSSPTTTGTVVPLATKATG